MARISLYIQTKKSEGKVKVRFRLKDGRDVQLYHKSEIEADLKDLEKLESDGTPKKRANFNRDLVKKISDRINLMNMVYDELYSAGEKVSTERFEEEIDKRLHPDKFESEEKNTKTLLDCYQRYIDTALISTVRRRAYNVSWRILNRYLIISGQEEIKIDEVTPEFILSFRDFIINEYKYAEKKRWKYLYVDVKKNNFPDEERCQNTVATKLKMFQAFFAQLEDADEIIKSPFRKLGKENRLAAIREQYAEPIALTLDEVRTIIKTDVPQTLLQTKQTFLLQCALGCRVGDFLKMGMDNLEISEDGIPYIRYIPNKTRHVTKTIKDVKTPLVRFAFDIIKETKFHLPILKYVSGKSGYNKKIKELLEHCKIDRLVDVINDSSGKLDRVPLWEMGCTKLCRKTNVTLLSRVQINSTIAGLHAEGSEAVKHYYAESIEDLFNLMSKAFGEETYKVDNNFNIKK